MAEEDALDYCFGDESISNEDENDDDDMQDVVPEHEDLLFDIVSNMKKHHGLSECVWKITGIRCSAHCLQLAIKDALINLSLPHKNIIDLCRSVAKHLRKSTTVNKLNANQIQYSLPRLDVSTRWCSTFLMVKLFTEINVAVIYWHIYLKFVCLSSILDFRCHQMQTYGRSLGRSKRYYLPISVM